MNGQMMTSGSKLFGKKPVFDLASIPVGETKAYEGLEPRQREALQRSAHNYNSRADMYFVTRSMGDVVYVMRIR